MLAAVVCPHPPLLIPEVAAGAAGELDELRAACDDALRAGLQTGPARVVVVGAGASTRSWPGDVAGALPGFGLPGEVSGAGEAWLPLSLTVGRWLLDRVGWDGPREYRAVAAGAPVEECAALGAALQDPTALLLVMGDASARRSAAAPGHLDARAEGFDAAVAAALANGRPQALLDLDVALAAELLAAGRPAWQVLAGAVLASAKAVAGATTSADVAGVTAALHYDAAPYGVGYLVATWLPS